MNQFAFYTILRHNPHLRLKYRQFRRGLAESGASEEAASGARKDFARRALESEAWRPFLGAVVTVTVDRPMCSPHPEHPELVYPVNYGYVEGVAGGDGEAQDAYLLRVDKPVETFTGRVSAVAERKDDRETKWVVTPVDAVVYEPEIAHALQFQEQYFHTVYHCLHEKSCGAVLTTRRGGAGERLYVLIENESGHIGFPKGHVEFGETESETALREIFEETGVRPALDGGFRESYRYRLGGGVRKEAVYFLARYEDGPLLIRQEEISRHWLVPFSQALGLLNFQEDRRVIRRAERYLRQKEYPPAK